jgi:hypothetical protein
MYDEISEFLNAPRKNLPALLVFDEVNALWPAGEQSVIRQEPWSLALFDALTLGHGALLVSGTTDCEFVAEIPTRANEILVSVGPLEPPERTALLRTQEFKVLLDLKLLDEKLWQHVVDASGSIPRELKKF